MLLTILSGVLLVLVVLPLGISLAFRGTSHTQYDQPRPIPLAARRSASEEHQAIVQHIREDQANTPKLGRKASLHRMREQMDQRGLGQQVDAIIQPITTDSLKGEWVIAENTDTDRRVLYIHGGAYMVGSPQSHRLITSRMSKAANAAVFAVDYRLMPENSRMAGIEDCRKAYLWVMANGPDGSSDASTLIVAGDSSGGNLALSVLAWARDSKQKPASAAVVFSPQTDLTLASPSLITNAATDIMQGESFGPIVKAPRFVRLAFSFLMHRINPKRPIVSPLHGHLADLPPILLQASATEMFLDDAVRYTNKANAQGTAAILQIWPSTLHVWQAFQIPEATEAFAEVEKFIANQQTGPNRHAATK